MAIKTIVAIHGIGEQTQYATAQSVVSQVCGYHRVGMPVPLGRFHASTSAPVIQMSSPPDPKQLHGLAFAEVYWAGIPREVIQHGFQLEETKAWGRTITNRLAERAGEMNKPMPRREQRRLVTVLDEVVETVKILERVNYLASRAGLFTFNLGALMRDFVGDVQIVADFPSRRDEILKTFDEVMARVMKLGDPAGDVELYLVAHSEGSVVTFLALLRALAEPEKHPWITTVRGVMTIGSPIETHHLLWPELWRQLKPAAKTSIRIPWKNYLDHGDPIAYELTETQAWLERTGFAKCFDFEEITFSRSLLPGKAHTDYWQDDQVFGHFIDHVIFQGQPPKTERAPTPRPRTLRISQAVSYAVPYLLVSALLFMATYFLYRPVLNALLPEDPPGRLVMFWDVTGIGLLLLGVTAASRIPRLTALWRWWTVGAAVLAACMWAYVSLTSDRTQIALGAVFAGWDWWMQLNRPETTGVLLIAVVIAALGVFLSSWFPRYGVKLLPILGLMCAAVLVFQLLVNAAEHVEVWPIVLGGVAFFYLWWLAALLFDLVFIWHRFVRHSAVAHGVADLTIKGYQPTVCERPQILRGA